MNFFRKGKCELIANFGVTMMTVSKKRNKEWEFLEKGHNVDDLRPISGILRQRT